MRVSSLHIWRPAGDDEVLLVAGVDLDLAAGEVCGIIGESGAGKTLTTRTMLGLLPDGLRATGEISIGDVSVDLHLGDPKDLLGRAGVVLQNPASMFDPMMRIGPQMIEAAVHHRTLTREAARDRALDLLEALGFSDPQHVVRMYPHQLSGGMVQRAAVATALLTRPPVLIVDEPTSALDASLRIEVLSLLRDLARTDGTAIIIVSHDLALVGRFCDSLHVMYTGRTVESGPTTSVLRHPAHPYTRALLAASLDLDHPRRNPVPMIGGAQPLPGQWPAGCAFAPRCPMAAAVCTESVPPLLPIGDQSSACVFADAST